MKTPIKYCLFYALLSLSGYTSLHAQFNNAQLFFAGNAGPWNLVYAADVDGDGDTDLVTQHADSSIYLTWNNGLGGFSTGELMAQNHAFYSMLDHGHDGDLDLVARDLATGIVRLYENAGFGDYSHWLQNFAYDPVSPPFYGDMDGDGDNDYLFGAGSGFNSSIFCCETGPPLPYCVQLNNISFNFTLCGGYFNQDNMVDFCISYNNSPAYTFNKNIGGGHFETLNLSAGFPAIMYNLPKGVGCADINGDGFEDLYFWSVELGRIVWRANDGEANFGPVQIIVDEAGLTATSLLIRPGDCDADGDADFLLLTDYGIRLFRNEGPGGFVEAPAPDVQDADIVFFEDMDGDGYDDIVVGRPSEVVWYPNDGACQFGDPQIALQLLAPAPESVSIADLDQNGKPDMLLCAPATGLIAWFSNLGNGQFGSLRAVATGLKQALDAFAADVNGDLLADVLAIQGAKAQPGYYSALGNGQFAAFVPLLPDSLEFTGRKIHAADADNDGDQDIFLSGSLARADAILLLLNTGAGQFDPPVNLTSLSATGYCEREHPDLNHDGDPDLLYRETATGALYWRPNEGGGNFGAAQPAMDDFDVSGIQAADMNGDLFPDIIAGGLNGEIAWFENPQNGQNFVRHDITSAALPYTIAVADFDGDGDQDIWAAPRPDSAGTAQRIQLYENDGSGNFQATFSQKNKDIGHSIAGSADMDTDGDADVYFCSGLFGGWYANRKNRPVIAGFCFEDSNENGQFDAGELPLPDMPLRIEPLGLLGYSKADGAFLFAVPEGDYNISPEPPACWALTSDSASYTVHFSGAPVLNHIFGFKNLGSAPSVLLHVSGNLPVCGAVIPHWISVKNSSCETLSGKIAVVHDSQTPLAGSDIPTSQINGDTLWWDFDTLTAMQTFQVAADFQLAAMNLNPYLDSLRAFVFLKNPDGSMSLSGEYFYEYRILCEFGWLHTKSVDKTYLDNNSITTSNELRYTIRFQNPGQDTIADVRVWDQLDSQLIWSSFRLLGSSHPVQTFLDLQKGIVEFYLPDAQLTDSLTNLRASRGIISFSMQLKPDVIPLALYNYTHIFNTALIYFDDQFAYPTNEVATIIYHVVGLNPTPELYPVRIFPNPTTGAFSVELPQAANPGLVLRLFDLGGRLVLEKQVPAGLTLQTVNTAGMPAGFYLLQVVDNGQLRATGKVIKH